MNDRDESIIYINRATENGINGTAPDKYSENPRSDFVLCRNQHGIPTAVYGDDVWDLNPYRLSSKQLTKITFSSINSDGRHIDFHDRLTSEIKHILYHVMYYSGSGTTGRISASTLTQYFYNLKSLAIFCTKQLDNDLAKGITIIDVLSNVSYVKAFLAREESSKFTKKQTSSLLTILNQIGNERIGFQPCSKFQLDFERGKDKQHPVIPSRIYIAIMNRFDEIVDAIYPHRENIKKLIIAMEDRNYGAAISTQGLRKPPIIKIQPTMAEAIAENNLDNLYRCALPLPKSRSAFATWLSNVQYVLKSTIHLYTGMRDQEVARLMFNCVSAHSVNDAIVDSKGDIIDASRMINIVSTTTKYTGFQKEDSWLAPDCVLKAIEIAKSITAGTAVLFDAKDEECPLLLKVSIIRTEKAKFSVSDFHNKRILQDKNGIKKDSGSFSLIALPEFHITNNDLYELSNTDPDRDFDDEEDYQEGRLWPISSHQYRRSLAFYASNSGFVSLPTVTDQFKHASRLLAQYYARNNENFLPIFQTKNKHEGVKSRYSHISGEFQLAVPISAIQLLFTDVFSDEATLMGGTGSFMEKQKRRIENGEITIFESKSKTIKMANKGEISYRQTLLGGCTKVGPCDDFLIGDITACLTCSGAIIKDSNIEKTLKNLCKEIRDYEPDSAEHQILEREINELTEFKYKKLQSKT